MRPTHPMTKFTATALGLALCAAMLTAPARAAEEGPSFEGKIIDGIMTSLGLRKDGDAINYSERAPLVLPSGKTLPPPERGDAAVANNPAWPKDPDVKRAKDEAAQQKNKLSAADTLFHDQRVLTESEMTPGPKPRATGKTSAGSYASSPYGYGNQLKPSELGYKGNLFGKMFGKDEGDNARFTGEAPRAALTDPPTGYQTPSPDQPYGLGKEMTAPKAYDYKNDHGTAGN